MALVFKTAAQKQSADIGKVELGTLVRKYGWVRVIRWFLRVAILTCSAPVLADFIFSRHDVHGEAFWTSMTLVIVLASVSNLLKAFEPGVRIDASRIIIDGRKIQRASLVEPPRDAGDVLEFVWTVTGSPRERHARLNLANYDSEDQAKIRAAVRDWASAPN